MTEKALRAFQARRAKMPIGGLNPVLSEKLDRIESGLGERARLEKILVEESQASFAQKTPQARRTLMFAVLTAGILRNPETLKSWIEALANLTTACNNSSNIRSKA